jgi:hypothetical protein
MHPHCKNPDRGWRSRPCARRSGGDSTLVDNIDVSRGDVISNCETPASVADCFDARLVGIGPDALAPSRSCDSFASSISQPIGRRSPSAWWPTTSARHYR